jgi:hypothetical protein
MHSKHTNPVIVAVMDAIVAMAGAETLSLVMNHLELSWHGTIVNRSPTRTDTAAGRFGYRDPSPPLQPLHNHLAHAGVASTRLWAARSPQMNMVTIAPECMAKEPLVTWQVCSCAMQNSLAIAPRWWGRAMLSE